MGLCEAMDAEDERREKREQFARLSLKAVTDAHEELTTARKKFPGHFASPHEAHAILQEEVDELWEKVKAAQKPRLFGTAREGDDALSAMRLEAIQVAAMALAMVVDIDAGVFHRDLHRTVQK